MAASATDDEEIVSINVTPLVDITLVLLIIFMVTASFVVRQTIDVDLPRPGSPGQSMPAIVNVVIDRAGVIYFDGSAVDERGLKTRLDGAIAMDPKTRAIVTADRALDYGQVLHLIDVVKGQGVANFGLNIQGAAGDSAAPR